MGSRDLVMVRVLGSGYGSRGVSPPLSLLLPKITPLTPFGETRINLY